MLARRRESQRSRNAVYRHGLSHNHIIFAAQPAQHAFQQSSKSCIEFCSLVQVWEVGLAFICDKIPSIGVLVFTALPSQLQEQKCTE